MPQVNRLQPWLGTFVEIRACGPDEVPLHSAVSEAFREVATVHRLMSFHQYGSDISRLNRIAPHRPLAVHRYTRQVLRQALALSAASEGCFDVSVAVKLAEAGLLPGNANSHQLDGTWRDIEILADGRVVFHRPLWIDLGGIAKGFAVDRAVARLRRLNVLEATVNAGGDLRVYGPHPELVALRLDNCRRYPAALELLDGSAASSSGYLHRRRVRGRWRGPHLDGAGRSPSRTDRFVCVVAEHCMLADALTKIVLAWGGRSENLLRQYRASAHVHDPEAGWSHLNGECAW